MKFCLLNKHFIKRLTALSLISILLLQQPCWAVGYGALALAPYQPVSSLNHADFNKRLASSTYRFLKPLLKGKPERVELKNGIFVDIPAGLPFSSIQDLERLSAWLKDPQTHTVPCSAYVLYNLITRPAKKDIDIGELVRLLILIDTLIGNIQPVYNAQRIDNSLYAMQKTAQAFGQELIPARLSTNSITPQFLNSLTPFIAHLNYSDDSTAKGHFVLVSAVDSQKVHFLNDKGDTFLPYEKFLEEFSGYCLVSASTISVISDSEAKSVLGAKRYYKGQQMDISGLFKKPSKKDLMISFGITLGATFAGGYFGNLYGAGAGGMQAGLMSMGTGMATSSVSQALMHVGIRHMGMKPGTAQIFGYATAGAISGGLSASQNSGAFTSKWFKPTSFWNSSPYLRGVTMGALKGGMVGGAKVGTYQALKNTSFYKKNTFIANQLISLVGSAVGYTGFVLLTSQTGFNLQTKVKVSEDGKAWGARVADSQTRTYSAMSYDDKSAFEPVNSNFVPTTETISMEVPATPVETIHGMQYTPPSGGFVDVTCPTDPLGALKFAWYDMRFDLISQGISLGVQYAAGKKYAKYSSLLGEGLGSLAAGRLTSGSGFSFKQAIGRGALTGLSSFALGYIGGEFDEKTGKNKLGFTEVQWAGISWLGTAAIHAGIGGMMAAAQGGQGLKTAGVAFGYVTHNFAQNLGSWGGTHPFATKGAGGWGEVMFIEKVADFGGFSNFKANADWAMKTAGYSSWKKFVKDGKHTNLFPRLSNSFVRYVASNLHSSAASNMVATIGYLPKSVTDFMGIDKHSVFTLKAQEKNKKGISALKGYSFYGITAPGESVGTAWSWELGGFRSTFNYGDKTFIDQNWGLIRRVKEKEITFSDGQDTIKLGEDFSHVGSRNRIEEREGQGFASFGVNDKIGTKSGLGGVLVSHATKNDGSINVRYEQNSFVGNIFHDWNKTGPHRLDVYTEGKKVPGKRWFNRSKIELINRGQHYVYFDLNNPNHQAILSAFRPATVNRALLNAPNSLLSKLKTTNPLQMFQYEKTADGNILLTLSDNHELNTDKLISADIILPFETHPEGGLNVFIELDKSKDFFKSSSRQSAGAFPISIAGLGIYEQKLAPVAAIPPAPPPPAIPKKIEKKTLPSASVKVKDAQNTNGTGEDASKQDIAKKANDDTSKVDLSKKTPEPEEDKIKAALIGYMINIKMLEDKVSSLNGRELLDAIASLRGEVVKDGLLREDIKSELMENLDTIKEKRFSPSAVIPQVEDDEDPDSVNNLLKIEKKRLSQTTAEYEHNGFKSKDLKEVLVRAYVSALAQDVDAADRKTLVEGSDLIESDPNRAFKKFNEYIQGIKEDQGGTGSGSEPRKARHTKTSGVSVQAENVVSNINSRSAADDDDESWMDEQIKINEAVTGGGKYDQQFVSKVDSDAAIHSDSNISLTKTSPNSKSEDVVTKKQLNLSIIGQTNSDAEAFGMDSNVVDAAQKKVKNLEQQLQEAISYKAGGPEATAGIGNNNNLSSEFNLNPDYDKELLNKLNKAKADLDAAISLNNELKNIPLIGDLKSDGSASARPDDAEAASYIQPDGTNEFFYKDKDGKTVLDLSPDSSFHGIALSNVYDSKLKMHVVTLPDGVKIFADKLSLGGAKKEEPVKTSVPPIDAKTFQKMSKFGRGQVETASDNALAADLPAADKKEAAGEKVETPQRDSMVNHTEKGLYFRQGKGYINPKHNNRDQSTESWADEENQKLTHDLTAMGQAKRTSGGLSFDVNKEIKEAGIAIEHSRIGAVSLAIQNNESAEVSTVAISESAGEESTKILEQKSKAVVISQKDVPEKYKIGNTILGKHIDKAYKEEKSATENLGHQVEGSGVNNLDMANAFYKDKDYDSARYYFKAYKDDKLLEKNARLPIESAIDEISSEQSNEKFDKMYQSIEYDIKNNESLSQASKDGLLIRLDIAEDFREMNLSSGEHSGATQSHQEKIVAPSAGEESGLKKINKKRIEYGKIDNKDYYRDILKKRESVNTKSIELTDQLYTSFFGRDSKGSADMKVAEGTLYGAGAMMGAGISGAAGAIGLGMVAGGVGGVALAMAGLTAEGVSTHVSNMEKMTQLKQDADRLYQDFYTAKDRYSGMNAKDANKARAMRVLQTEIYELNSAQKESSWWSPARWGEGLLNLAGLRVPDSEKMKTLNFLNKGLANLKK